ncbi:formate dehydrogenase accessory sulfurtransferase FdhD [Cetobacterium sp. SF1]|uniref:formate dehydrogenase accessory sulfurtransferase FdhD n=1 Tax=unclassified Cetobacterium TaxID=2630983 RepID=UPI003CF88F36
MKKINLFTEAPVRLVINSQDYATFMCTPKELEDMALGFIYAKEIIKNKSEILGISPCENNKRVLVVLDKEIPGEVFDINTVVLSGCGNGLVFQEEKIKFERINFNYEVSLKHIKENFITMLEKADMHNNIGGSHCAGLKLEKYPLIIREDIGRHNAVDKVIGAGLNISEEESLKKSMILITGRVSSDMILKAAGAKIPLVVTLRIPSDLALSIAERFGVVIIGRIMGSEPIIYNFSEGIQITK